MSDELAPYRRTLELTLPRGQSAFLWGPRKTGKSTLLRRLFPRSARFDSVARDCGVDSKTVREYFQILVDTLLGVFLEPFRSRRTRAVIIRAPKFYLFDVGVAGYLAGRRVARAAGPDFGRALEHFVLMELLAFRSYRECDYPVRFWRTKSGLECDFVLGREGAVALEVKGSANPGPRELRGLRAYAEEHRPALAAVICTAGAPRRTPDGILILPWEQFLERLWAGAIIT